MPFPLRLVTPEKISWEGEVDSLVVPAFQGQLGILPGHTPLLAQLTEGVVKLRVKGEERLLAVSGGFVEVVKDHVSLFAESAELTDEIDAERALQAAAKARAELKSHSGDRLDAQAEAALRRALARLRAVEMARRRAPGSAPAARPPAPTN